MAQGAGLTELAPQCLQLRSIIGRFDQRVRIDDTHRHVQSPSRRRASATTSSTIDGSRNERISSARTVDPSSNSK